MRWLEEALTASLITKERPSPRSAHAQGRATYPRTYVSKWQIHSINLFKSNDSTNLGNWTLSQDLILGESNPNLLSLTTPSPNPNFRFRSPVSLVSPSNRALRLRPYGRPLKLVTLLVVMLLNQIHWTLTPHILSLYRSNWGLTFFSHSA